MVSDISDLTMPPSEQEEVLRKEHAILDNLSQYPPDLVFEVLTVERFRDNYAFRFLNECGTDGLRYFASQERIDLIKAVFDITLADIASTDPSRPHMNESRLLTFVKAVDPFLSNEILMQLSDHYGNSAQSTIVDFDKHMKTTKCTDRSLPDYMALLGITPSHLMNLEERSLLLIGGGRSSIKTELADERIRCDVTNIDALDYGPNEASADTVITADFFAHDFQGSKFNEIWANHSLPMYAMHPRQVAQFYERAIGLLHQGGTLRVSPAQGSYDAFTLSMMFSRKPVNEACLDVLDFMDNAPDLLEVRGNPTGSKGLFGEKKSRIRATIRLVGSQQDAQNYLASYKSSS